MDKSKILYVKNEKCFLFDGSEFVEEKPSLAKQYPVASTVAPSALYVYSSKLPASLSNDEAELQMDINMHEEGGASEDEEYATAILRHKLSADDNDLVDIFGLAMSQANTLYGDLVKKTKSIDIIAPSFIIYKTFYKDKQVSSTDLYLYFSDEEAYGVIFRDGEYIAHRTIDNLAHFSAHSGVDLDTLKSLLKTKGVKEELYAQDELTLLTAVQDYMSKALERIIHTFNHKRGLFGLDGIDKVFIDFEGSIIPGCEDIFKAFGIEINSIKALEVDANKDPILHHDFISASYLLEVLKGNLDSVNVTPFERELPFFKKPVGHFFSFLALALMLVIAGWCFLQVILDSQNEKISTLNADIMKAKNAEEKAKIKIKELSGQFQVLSEEVKKATQEEETIEQTEDAILIFDSAAIKRTGMVDDALRGLNKNRLAIKKMDQNGSTKLSLYIITTEDRQPNIAKFIEYMAQKGYQKSYTKQIIQKNGINESIVEIVR